MTRRGGGCATNEGHPVRTRCVPWWDTPSIPFINPYQCPPPALIYAYVYNVGSCGYGLVVALSFTQRVTWRQTDRHYTEPSSGQMSSSIVHRWLHGTRERRKETGYHSTVVHVIISRPPRTCPSSVSDQRRHWLIVLNLWDKWLIFNSFYISITVFF